MENNYKEDLKNISTFIFDVDGVLTDDYIDDRENGNAPSKIEKRIDRPAVPGNRARHVPEFAFGQVARRRAPPREGEKGGTRLTRRTLPTDRRRLPTLFETAALPKWGGGAQRRAVRRAVFRSAVSFVFSS